MDATLGVALGLASSIVSEYLNQSAALTSGQLAWSDWLSWGILAAGGYIYNRVGSTYNPISPDVEAQTVQGIFKLEIYGVTVLALLVAPSQFLASVLRQGSWWTLPLVTISTYTVRRLLFSNGKPSEQYDITRSSGWELYASRNFRIALGPLPFLALFISVSIASSIALGLLPESESPSVRLWAVPFLVLQTLIYVLLGRKHGQPHSESQISRSTNLHTHTLFSLSIQTFAVWTLLVISFYPRSFLLSPINIVFGLVKACQVWVLVTLCTKGHNVPATTIGTFATSLLAALRVDSYSLSSGMAVVAIGALLQCVSSMSSSARYRYWLLTFSLLPMAAVLSENAFLDMGTRKFPNEAGWTGPHPIQRLVASGRVNFKALLESQSQTLKRAVEEYQRRYGRRPPPQFDKWFKLAYSENYVLVDEFDSIMEILEPFWGMRPAAIRDAVASALSAEHVARLTVRGDSVAVSSSHWLALTIQNWLNWPERLALLPDMDVPINLLDEPRVVAPFDVVSEARRAARHQHSTDGIFMSEADFALERDVTWTNAPGKNAWPAIEVSCPEGSAARADDRPLEKESHTHLEFITNLTESVDVCTHADYKLLHGFLAAPQTLSVTHAMIPMFSQAKPSIFQDVLYPSPYYTGRMDYGDYNEEDDHDWEEKRDNLYWTGASTGGHSRIDNWQSLHRQRLVLMAEAGSTLPVTLLNETRPNVWQPHQTSWAQISELFDVRITAVGAQCDPDACTAMREHFGLVPIPDPDNDPQKDPLSASYRSKYVLDVDGNTFSGRFYRVLGSKCAVLKQTIMKEWHDGRLVPWVHFIPVSLEADELGEVMRFLINEKAGQKIGRQIAEDGRNWANTVFRKVDLQITFLRILMEYGRVISDDRDSLYYA